MNDDFTDLRPFFELQSVAPIGARRKAGFGYAQTWPLPTQGFEEILFFVHPSKTEICGNRVFPKVTDIPFPVDLAVAVLPARVCSEIMAQCATKSVKAFGSTPGQGR